MTCRIDCFRRDFASQRQFHYQRKARAFPDPVRLCLKMPAMHFRERICNSEPETQAAVPSRSRPICLTEPIEHMWQKLRNNSNARIDDDEAGLFAVELGG